MLLPADDQNGEPRIFEDLASAEEESELETLIQTLNNLNSDSCAFDVSSLLSSRVLELVEVASVKKKG